MGSHVSRSVHTRTKTRKLRTTWRWRFHQKCGQQTTTRSLAKALWDSRKCRWRRRKLPSFFCPRYRPVGQCRSRRWRWRRNRQHRGQQSETPWSRRMHRVCTRMVLGANHPEGPGSKRERNFSENWKYWWECETLMDIKFQFIIYKIKFYLLKLILETFIFFSSPALAKCLAK